MHMIMILMNIHHRRSQIFIYIYMTEGGGGGWRREREKGLEKQILEAVCQGHAGVMLPLTSLEICVK